MSPTSQLPRHFEQLSPQDQEGYRQLQQRLSSKDCRNNRNHRVDKFGEMIATIRAFCERDDKDDSLRYLVCGAVMLPGAIAVNTRQLRILIDKCKSSINGSLQRMKCMPVSLKNEIVEFLYQKVPQLRDNFMELREWSVRQMGVSTPQPQIPKCDYLQGESAPTPAPSIGCDTRTSTPTVSLFASNDSDDPFCLTPSFLDDDFDW